MKRSRRTSLACSRLPVSSPHGSSAFSFASPHVLLSFLLFSFTLIVESLYCLSSLIPIFSFLFLCISLSSGGKTCHAAVVARGIGLPAVVGAGDLEIDEEHAVANKDHQLV